jgi:integrase
MKKSNLDNIDLLSLPEGKHFDGNGLFLNKRAGGSSQWVVRFSIHKRRREMGLGAFPGTSLAKARISAQEARMAANEEIDPIKERADDRRSNFSSIMSFRDVAYECFNSRKKGLKNNGLAGNWLSPIEKHVIPKIGNVPIESLTQHHVKRCLEPIWNKMPATALKAINRTAIILNHASAYDIKVDTQATHKAKILLGYQERNEKHIESMKRDDIADFYSLLSRDRRIASFALRMLILTGARTNSIRHMRTEQIQGNLWIIPPEFMKGKKGKTIEFRLPLSRQSIKLLNDSEPHIKNGFIFPNSRGGPLGTGAMSALMNNLGITARPHGFRSTLRDWLDVVEGADYAVAETILAHTVGNKSERAYRRSDYLDQRKIHMNNWADFVLKDG